MASPGSNVASVVLTAPPRLSTSFVRAALTSRGRGGYLPRTRLSLPGQHVDAGHLADYARVCGFDLSGRLPVTYPHVLAFGLQVQLMAHRSFPLPLAGMVHVANSITQCRGVALDEVLELTVWAQDLREHPRGALVDLRSEARVAEELVWSGRSSYLAKGRKAPPGATTLPPGPPPSTLDLPVPERFSVSLQLPSDLGRRYAAVSGDINPIHLNPLTAKAFGFPRAIAHGMWTHARCLAALSGRLPDAFTATAEFRRPVLLPSAVTLHSARDAAGSWAVEMRSKSSELHLRTTVVAQV